MSDVKDRPMSNAERKERRGFASMSPEKQREIASKGGRAAHQKGTAHEWTSDEARIGRPQGRPDQPRRPRPARRCRPSGSDDGRRSRVDRRRLAPREPS